jgi:8-oxo-dGTP pyrophosphatase MutT (NUDIX family)
MGTQKAKVAVVNKFSEILVLTRSEQEDTRQGEDDWPGGTLEAGETPVKGVLRESGAELPGTTIHNLTELDIHRKTKSGLLVVSHLFAATADFPPDGIELSFEHSDHRWVPIDEFEGTNMPNKYKRAVALGTPVLKELVELCQQPPAPMLLPAI